VSTTGEPFKDPTRGEAPTPFALYGDPVTGNGWVDGLLHHPGDRRAGISSGPFNMAPGDTQEVVFAEIAAIGSNQIQSIVKLKYFDLVVQKTYDRFLM
jgi:hypothetical protein